MLYPTTDEALAVQERPTLCCVVAVPDPVKVSIVGVWAALREMLPDAVPLARGAKVRLNDTVWPAEIVLGKEIPPD